MRTDAVLNQLPTAAKNTRSRQKHRGPARTPTGEGDQVAPEGHSAWPGPFTST